jgi:LDH2 family malate/lactate/ureidoglycolate dehydrogenase
MRVVNPERFRLLAREILVGYDLPIDQASLVADTLVEADLRGVRSHGVIRIPRFVGWLKSGAVNRRPDIKVVVDSGSTAVVDGDGAMGQVSADVAMRLAVSRAAEHGIGAVGLRDGRHCGTMAYWAMMAPPAGCIGFAATNAGLNMAPWGGKDKIVGNNPFAIAVPTTRPWTMVLDMATSVAAGGKLDVAAARGEPIPLGWALDEAGSPTTDARAGRLGSLLPVGGPKGYGMALMIDVLAGVLTGGRFAAGMGLAGDGQFFLALQVERFMALAEFHARMDAMIDEIHASAKAPGVERVYVPGEIEHESATERLANGLPIEETILGDLKRLAEAAGVSAEGLLA